MRQKIQGPAMSVFKKKKKSNYVVVDLHVHFVTFWYQKHLTYCNVLISRIFEILQHIVSSPQEFCLKKKQFKVKWKKNENLFIFIRAITLTDYYYILVFFFKNRADLFKKYLIFFSVSWWMSLFYATRVCFPMLNKNV